MGTRLRRIAGIEKKPYVRFAANGIQFRSLKITHLQCFFTVGLQCAAEGLGSKNG